MPLLFAINSKANVSPFTPTQIGRPFHGTRFHYVPGQGIQILTLPASDCGVIVSVTIEIDILFLKELRAPTAQVPNGIYLIDCDYYRRPPQ